MKDCNEYNDDFYYCHDDANNSDMRECMKHENCKSCPYYYAEEE